MKKETVKSIILAAMAVLALTGCNREEHGRLGGDGEIVFHASTSWQNGGGKTRTEYSGEFNTIAGDGRYERIEWVPDTDLIRIYCHQAGADGSSCEYADYKVVSPVSPATPAPSGSQTEKSTAGVAPASADANTLRWSSGAHHFYAMYPAPDTKWKYDGTQSVADGDATITYKNPDYTGAVVTGVIPSSQVVRWNSTQKEYEPNMNYAYMYAATSVEAGNEVFLSFKPLVTTLQFTIKAGDADAADLTLTGFKLKSESVYLSGRFAATLDGTTDTPAISVSTDGDSPEPTKEVSVLIAQTERQTLATDDLIKVTLFTLAAATLDELSIELTFLNGANQEVVRSLELKARDNADEAFSWITVNPTCKAYINSLGVPGNPFQYYLGTLSSLTLACAGGTGTLASGFTSYRSNGLTTIPVPFELEYSEDDGATWSSTPPSWMSVTGVDTNGGAAGQTFSATAKHQENTNDPHHTTLSESSRARGTAAQPFDLSGYNVATTRWADNTTSSVGRTTANCYVVQGSGYYKFPLVYGNGFKNGSPNESAYHAKAGVGGAWRNGDANGPTNQNTAKYLGYFQDHLGGTITSPYITVQHGGKNFTAELLWTDEPELVTDVALDGDELTFCVPPGTITQGNALVAVKADGVIAWSWHIWVTDEDLTATAAGSNNNLLAPVNLGWCEGKGQREYVPRSCKVRAKQNRSGTWAYSPVATISQEGGTDNTAAPYGNCLYYQWGRKDPMWASDGSLNSGTEWANSYNPPKKYYPTSDAYAFPETDGNYAYGNPGVQLSTVGRVSIGTAIQHPTTYYSRPETAPYGNGSMIRPSDWCDTPYINRWSSTMNGTGSGQNANAKTKTVYDPCPVGFRVPSMDAWSSFSSSAPLSGNMRKFGDLYFPRAGLHVDWSGAIHFFGYRGQYWSSNPYNANYFDCAYVLRFWTSDVSPEADAYNDNATPIRPVKEEINQGDSVSGYGITGKAGNDLRENEGNSYAF